MILQSPNHLVCPQEALGAHGAGGGPGAQEDMPGSAQGEDSGEGSAEYYSSYGGDFEKVTKRDKFLELFNAGSMGWVFRPLRSAWPCKS